MRYALLLCDVRAGAAHATASEALIILARINLILRRAREARSCVTHVSRSRHGRVQPSLPGYEPLPSEAVFSAEEGANFRAGALIESITNCGGVAAAGFSLRGLMAPALMACADASLPTFLLQDAADLGQSAEFSMHALAKKGVRVLTVDAFLASQAVAPTHINPRY